MRTTVFLSVCVLIFMGHMFSCEPEDWLTNIDCSECFYNRPDTASLIVHVTINEENDSVPLTFYRGTMSSGVIDWKDTATTDEFYLPAEIDAVYTVEARYRSGTETILAYDSDKMTLSDYGEQCGDPCYIVRGGIFEVQLMD